MNILLPKKCRLLIPFLFLASGFPLSGAEYFVNKSGRDDNSGTSPTAAFLTIQRGVDALAAGDTLTIGPGEYAEKVARKGLGEAGKRTVIRAEIPGTVLLRGDVRAPEFRPLENRVFVADFDGEVQSVNEVDTLTSLEPVPNVDDLPFRPASYHYDAAAKKLYLSTSDLRPAASHAYTVSVIGDNGFFLDEPVGVTVEGIAATGFNSSREPAYIPGNFVTWGILLFKPTDCVVRNCTVYLNGGGIAVNPREENERNNVIEYCTAYGNSSAFGSSGGNIAIFSPKDGVIRHCLAYGTRENGLRLYGQGMKGVNAIEDSLGWGNNVDLFIKGGGDLGTAIRSVAVGAGHIRNAENVLVGRKNIYLEKDEWPQDSIHLEGKKLDSNLEFADPENFDFRLQSTSRFRGAGPDGTDQGAYPYRANIFYVKPDGDDAADGLSLGTAWATLGRAARNLRAGDTLYLEPGRYDEAVKFRLNAQEPVVMRGRGAGRAVLAGDVTVEGGAFLFERIVFEKTVRVDGGKDSRFLNCQFSGSPDGLVLRNCEGLRVEHGAFSGFTGAAMRVSDSSGLHLSGNLFDNRKGVVFTQGEEASPGIFEKLKGMFGGETKTSGDPVVYSDYNAYAKLEAAGPHSTEVSTDALDAAFREDRPGIPGLGALGKPAGVFRDALDESVFMSKPYVHSVSATTANLEWTVTDKLICEIAWGETPECKNTLQYEVDRYGSFSLTGLKPATTYYFQIRSLSFPYRQYAAPGPAFCAEPEFGVISFTTAAEPMASREYYVAADGDDSRDGLSRATAWRSVARAASRVMPGDTVWIAGGSYPERVRVRATGEEGAPITFRSLPGERVEFTSGGKLLEESWVINGKSHIEMDGFYFSQFRLGGGNQTGPRVFSLYGSNDIEISRCFYDARGKGYGTGFLTVRGGRNVTASNCVMISGFNSIGVSGCENFRLEHSVVVVPMIQATMIGASDKPNILENNIFTDISDYKVKAKVWMHEWKGQNEIMDKNNAYFLRVPDAERQHYWILSFHEKGRDLGHTRMSLEEYRRRVRDTDSFIADPQFAGLIGKQPPPKTGYIADFFISGGGQKWDFPDFYATNPEVLRRGIGLQAEKFRDFHFQKKK